MNIILNGEPAELRGTTVADLIAQTAPKKPFAVAVNTGFVAKGAYTETVLNENDKV
ncbi:sulfur carrier protein ThiS, partial [Streptococcus anginosus]